MSGKYHLDHLLENEFPENALNNDRYFIYRNKQVSDTIWKQAGFPWNEKENASDAVSVITTPLKVSPQISLTWGKMQKINFQKHSTSHCFRGL